MVLLPGSWVKAEFAGLAGKCVKPRIAAGAKDVFCLNSEAKSLVSLWILMCSIVSYHKVANWKVYGTHQFRTHPCIKLKVKDFLFQVSLLPQRKTLDVAQNASKCSGKQAARTRTDYRGKHDIPTPAFQWPSSRNPFTAVETQQRGQGWPSLGPQPSSGLAWFGSPSDFKS